MIYLDNASTSFPKPKTVCEAMNECLSEYCANPGRGAHEMARRAAVSVAETRELLAKLFNFDHPERIVFTKNATEALNTAIKGILKPGDHVITTALEHNSVIRPLAQLKKDIGIEVSVLFGSRGVVSPEDIADRIRQNTALIITGISSNVNGAINPIKEIGELADRTGITFLVDGSQGAGSLNIDCKAMHIDLLAFPGHKGLMGPQGTGGLCVSPSVDLRSLMQGGTGTESENINQPKDFPEAIESGTLNTPGIVGLGASLKFLNDVGLNRIRGQKNHLIFFMHSELKDVPGVRVFSTGEPGKNSGILAFNIDGMTSMEVGKILDEWYGIGIRTGLHCAPFASAVLGYTSYQGVARMSVGYFNTFAEVEEAVRAIKVIAKEVAQ